eukprot:604386-Rhodomonas_salina.2
MSGAVLVPQAGTEVAMCGTEKMYGCTWYVRRAVLRLRMGAMCAQRAAYDSFVGEDREIAGQYAMGLCGIAFLAVLVPACAICLHESPWLRYSHALRALVYGATAVLTRAYAVPFYYQSNAAA